MLDKLSAFFANKRVLLLGFGLEGQSTLRLLQKLDCAATVEVRERHLHPQPLPDGFDIIMKSPGIPLFEPPESQDPRITGQTDLFLRYCDNPLVGITGTKGKSTTSSLLYHILLGCGKPARLIGNIGVPPLDAAGKLAPDETVVMELSCHQLEYVQASPAVAVLLNIYEEHLDHYIDFAHYKYVKENIYRHQREGDVLIRGEEVDYSRLSLDVSKVALRGKHNLRNIAIAVEAATVLGVQQSEAVAAAYSFPGLEHRLEVVTRSNSSDGRLFVNDSISTIPRAAIAAVEAFPETDTLIIGGMDRGVDYSELVDFLRANGRIQVIALPDSGHKIAPAIPGAYKAVDMVDAVDYAKRVTKRCCVLSPAAASYGVYVNFEERGRHFKELVGGCCHPNAIGTNSPSADNV